MKEVEVNNFVTNLYQLIDSNEQEKAKTLLIDMLILILKEFPLPPKDKIIEYDMLEYLFFQFNKKYVVEEAVELNDDFPLNSYLVNCFEDPAEINAILFHMYEYFHPEGYRELTAKELIEGLDQIKNGQKSKLTKHTFSFENGVIKIVQNGSTHLLSF